MLGDGMEGRAVPVLEAQDGGLHHVFVLGVGGGGFRGHLVGLLSTAHRGMDVTRDQSD